MHIYLFVGNGQQAVQTTSNWIESLPHISQKEVYAVGKHMKTNNKQDDE